jgi:7-carboxy-7-deazaguanine synthase
VQQYIDGYDYQLKFVVDRKPDIDEVRTVITQLQHIDASRVMLMARGVNQAELNRKAEWIVESCKQYGFSYTPRLHIQLFGNRRGT